GVSIPNMQLDDFPLLQKPELFNWVQLGALGTEVQAENKLFNIKESSETHIPHWSQWNSTTSSQNSLTTLITYFKQNQKKYMNFTIFRSKEGDIITKTFEEQTLEVEHGYEHRLKPFSVLEQKQGQKDLRVKCILGVQMAQRLLIALLDASLIIQNENETPFIRFLQVDILEELSQRVLKQKFIDMLKGCSKSQLTGVSKNLSQKQKLTIINLMHHIFLNQMCIQIIRIN
ncbi:hypothetical protein ABPG72_002910, partial [Tetrahymena utriculariae]